ncbi:phosphatidylglycerophosphatase A [Psychrobacillus vulpis]|uniref:Phosphatidylglycerophosphatase A n=1 Tax=Psychrobacillus vulpis TaxID=2325572 RepID=A0A544TRX7_9BACI|nr:phosphatidylglycerophosphatase A [Psychrobacillus vulpis]TQR20195.1 phosphatidylglycerophosphatase A [Psychrobacillus vulpis]
MDRGTSRVHSRAVEKAANDALLRRGVTIEEIAKIVYEMQIPYNKGLTIEHCVESIKSVLKKREMQHAILVGIELDELAEKKMLSEPLQQLVESDEGLFGVDETIALGSVYTYGSIAVTTFGHLDKNKIGLISKLDTKSGNGVHTFLDDLVGSIAASAASRLAHRTRDLEEANETFEDIPPEDTAPEANITGVRT